MLVKNKAVGKDPIDLQGTCNGLGSSKSRSMFRSFDWIRRLSYPHQKGMRERTLVYVDELERSIVIYTERSSFWIITHYHMMEFLVTNLLKITLCNREERCGSISAALSVRRNIWDSFYLHVLWVKRKWRWDPYKTLQGKSCQMAWVCDKL